MIRVDLTVNALTTLIRSVIRERAVLRTVLVVAHSEMVVIVLDSLSDSWFLPINVSYLCTLAAPAQ